MARNIEIKSYATNFEHQQSLAEQLTGSSATILKQHDTFFKVSEGRLKLREFGDGTAELISYQRPDKKGPKLSSYQIVKIADPAKTLAVLDSSIGKLATVDKTRYLYLHGRTRLHFDQVVGLGGFIELEVVLKDKESLGEAEAEVKQIMTTLEITESDLIETAYVDLMPQTSRV